MKTLAEIAPISARILVENRSSEYSDRKLPISTSVRHGFFLPSGNRQFPMGKNASIRNGLRPLKPVHAARADKAGKGDSSTRQSGAPQSACVKRYIRGLVG